MKAADAPLGEQGTHGESSQKTKKAPSIRTPLIIFLAVKFERTRFFNQEKTNNLNHMTQKNRIFRYAR